MSTIRDLLKSGIGTLKNAHVDNSEYDARALMEYALNCDRNYILLHMNDTVEDEKKVLYGTYIDKRSTHYPLQYIIGSSWFMNYEFMVNESVLIPRQDTEILVEEVIKYIKPDYNILDMCTGSGCIGISIYKEACERCINNVKVTLADISCQAINVAQKNASKLEADVDIIETDIYSNIEAKYNVIVSNPPYIKSQVIPTLMEEVKNYEPMMALDGLEDGLHFYRIIINNARRYLYEQGYVFLEIGCDQAADIREIFVDNQFEDIKVIKDLAGLDRVVYAHI